MKRLVKISLVLAFTVILLGAYTRLTDAGLGCPDWPGCYGHLLVPSASSDVAAANLAYPERPVETVKAWNEMVHRYFAGSLGLLILWIFIKAFKETHEKRIRITASILLALVTFQAALGMWTVTMNLMPVVVMAHLLGGFAVFSGLYLLHLMLNQPQKIASATQRTLSVIASVALVVLVAQIALGGWTSTNYASLACTELPICEEGWQQRITLSEAFSVPEADNYEYGVHAYEARMTMHVVHRIGAAICTLALLALVAGLAAQRRIPGTPKAMFLISSLLAIQVLLGISNVMFSLPLYVAVAHNGVAALLLLSLVRVNLQLSGRSPEVMYG